MFGTMPTHLIFGPELWPYALCEYDIPDLPRMQAPVLRKDNTYYLATQKAARTIQGRLQSELSNLLTTDVALARDLAYFGDSQLNKIVDAYGITEEQLAERLDDKEFTLLVKTFRKDMEKDVNGMVRARAKLYLDAEMDLMHEAIMDRHEKLSERLAGFKMMAQLADAVPRNEGGAGGSGAPVGPAANIVFNFGSNSPFSTALGQVIEGQVTRTENQDG